MLCDHVLVHEDDAGALHAALGAPARAGLRHVLVLVLGVGAEVGGLREADVAERALERLLPRVHDHVVQQGLPRDEVLAADAARQHLLPGVEPHVQVQVPLPQVRLPALHALKVGLLGLLFL